jgi:calmodulin
MNHALHLRLFLTALREAFRLFDKDGDGNITANELFEVMSSIGQMVTRQQAIEMIQLVDTDGE